MEYKIAVITPQYKNDYLTDTVIDGLLSLQQEDKKLEFYMPSAYFTSLSVKKVSLDRQDFKDFAGTADLILFCWGKGNTDYDLAGEIGRFDKTVFIDGSEIGKNGRFDSGIQKQILDGTYEGNGKIDKEMLQKCALYFRREKPYVDGILPLPFGIESKYSKYYSPDTKKDMDFFCVFGQDEYPVLRKQVQEVLIEFCEENDFSCFTKKTDQDNFYRTLARSKVGISVGGGGFDTARFWEILGNNCILLTEKIDIYEEGSNRLKYDTVWQFRDLEDFKIQLDKIGVFLKNTYNQKNLQGEYLKIMRDHSSKSRAMEIIQKAREKGIIQ